jgi:hypothetical protein
MSDPLETAINETLQAFAQNPVAQMDAQPQKYDASGERPVSGVSAFDQEQIAHQDFIGARDALRKDILDMDAASPTRAPFAANDRAENLVDEFHYASLSAMDRSAMMSAELPVSPWSDDYWALYLGVLGRRYADPGFPASPDWKENFDYIIAHQPGAILDSGDAGAIDRLSPAEKYDLLVGDDTFTLTRLMWNEGRVYYDRSGKVESWMGICHGWAPAAYMLTRPTSAAEVIAAQGTALTFYPSDIKALASLLWANVRTQTRFIGGRCDDKDPARDPQTGRVVSTECFDTNPASWHLAVVNQIGASQRSTVMDATFDYEVWNQPVLSYDYRYFNPQQMRYARSLDDAQVSMAQFTNDPFKDYRSSAAASVVGIAMDLSYIVETRPTHDTSDGPAKDGINRVRYFYDIELDAMGGMIGGEWYSNKHPDFLWTPPEGEKATTQADAQAVGLWRRNESLPVAWQRAGQQAAAINKAPLASIVERLIAFANS